jgi:predicted ester cyclase
MFRGAMPDLKMSIEDEVYSGDRVVHSWKIQGKHTGTPLFGVPTTGKDLTLTGITIVRLENGKIVERWTQLDQLGLLQQLGVIPPANKPS